jgi:hypothetical protein
MSAKPLVIIARTNMTKVNEVRFLMGGAIWADYVSENSRAQLEATED